MLVVSSVIIADRGRGLNRTTRWPTPTITLITLGVVVVLFVSNRLPVEVVAVGAALALYATGVLDPARRRWRGSATRR